MPTPFAIISALALVFAVIFGLFLLRERDPQAAAEETSRRTLGVGIGASGVLLAALTELFQVAAEVPGLLIGVAGVGSIIAGLSWEMFAAIAVLTYIVAAGIRGE